MVTASDFSVCSDTPLFDSRDKFEKRHRLAELHQTH